MRNAEFRCFAVCPGALESVAPAVAAARAGAAGILDVTFCDGAAMQRALRNLSEALRVTAPNHEIGLRVGAGSIAAAAPLLAALAPRRHTVIVAEGWDASAAASLAPSALRTLLVEASDAEALDAQIAGQIDGIVIAGRECGGWVGGESGFILLQRLLDRGVPLLLRGAAGPRTVAA
ncbi:MAG TPA: hypothetical protein VI670_16475, partial [Thermoanaerobaculia bacterium]